MRRVALGPVVTGIGLIRADVVRQIRWIYLTLS